MDAHALSHRKLTKRSHHTSLPFPLPDSFPMIYEDAPASGEGAASIAARASLSIETSVADQISELRTVVAGALGSDERELLLHGLGDIAEAYRSGWHSGSDSGDDDDDS